MFGWLLACLVGNYAWRLLRLPNPWPRRFLGGAAWFAGIDVRQRGTPAARPLLLLANHVSWIDVLALAGIAGARFVAHDGLAAFPLLRWLCELNDTTFIARDRRGAVIDQAQQLGDALSSRHSSPLVLFPEGATGDGVTLMPFKSALLSAVSALDLSASIQLSVQPV